MAAASERARASVTKAIRTTIERIAANEPALADVLDRSIRTGSFCGYQPSDPALVWEL
jgi:hypothetical protein